MNTKHAIRMLIVEDHAGLATNLYEFFCDDRYILDFASDGLTALHLIATNDYDVIILDVMLPGLSGFEICRRIRQDIQSSTPVIILTSKDQLQDKEEGFSDGGFFTIKEALQKITYSQDRSLVNLSFKKYLMLKR